MRQMLNTLALAILCALFCVVFLAIYGPHPLPASIPVHFDNAGHVNGWGSPFTLFFLPGVALAVYAIMALVAQFPESFNYPVRVTDENRSRLEELTYDLMAWMKFEIVCLCSAITWLWLQSIRHPGNAFSPLWILVFVGIVLATVAGYIVAMARAAR